MAHITSSLERENVENTLNEPPKMHERCCGRKITVCNCMSNKTFLAIALVVGAILLAFGILGLIGHFVPATGASASLKSIIEAANIVASKLGSDLFTLSMFVTAFGTAFCLTGGVGLYIERQQPPATILKEKNSNDEGKTSESKSEG